MKKLDKTYWMMALAFLMFIITILTASAQDKRFTGYLYTEPQHYLLSNNENALVHFKKSEEKINFGFGVEYQMTLVYFNAEVYLFPDLNNLDYAHIQGTVLGFNLHSKFDEWRYYLGAIRLGLISRESGFLYPMFGSNIGIERYFEGIYFGISTGYDWKSDDKAWDPKGTGHGVWQAGIKIGIVL